jgi:hypothetical protein
MGPEPGGPAVGSETFFPTTTSPFSASWRTSVKVVLDGGAAPSFAVRAKSKR